MCLQHSTVIFYLLYGLRGKRKAHQFSRQSGAAGHIQNLNRPSVSGEVVHQQIDELMWRAVLQRIHKILQGSKFTEVTLLTQPTYESWFGLIRFTEVMLTMHVVTVERKPPVEPD